MIQACVFLYCESRASLCLHCARARCRCVRQCSADVRTIEGPLTNGARSVGLSHHVTTSGGCGAHHVGRGDGAGRGREQKVRKSDVTLLHSQHARRETVKQPFQDFSRPERAALWRVFSCLRCAKRYSHNFTAASALDPTPSRAEPGNCPPRGQRQSPLVRSASQSSPCLHGAVSLIRNDPAASAAHDRH